MFKQDIVKSRLKHLLQRNHNPKIFARKCTVKEIDSQTKNLFLEKFHLQGKDSSSVKIGGYYNDKLVAVMTFSYGNISKGSRRKAEVWELNRFCSDYNYNIVGIAGKLLKYFQRKYEWKEIYSYADRRWSVGNLYAQLGFDFVQYTTPNYWYIKNYSRIHRFSLRKSINNKDNLPESIIRKQQGYGKIWDCGHIKYAMVNGG